MSMSDDDNRDENYDPSRRRFLKNTGILAGGVVGGSVLGGLLTNQFQTKPEVKEAEIEKDLQEARMFFDRKEDFNVLSAATERIFPEDENGPGAIELGVPYFIDKQLASGYGMNEKEYMQGPFFPRSEEHTSELQSRGHLVCRLLLEKKKK